jgi:drug/metabolite transporter (DMT)-like permease
MLLRDGPRGMLALFRAMGWPGIAVGCCFSTASTSFLIALQYTTVANILLIQSSVPLIAALMSWLIFRETVSAATWTAIAAVIFGIAIMVSDSITGMVSPLGSALSVLIALGFASATVITQRFSHVRMTPACCLGTILSMAVSAALAQSLAVTLGSMALLFVFGAFNLGLGLALFALGVRLVPATLAALIGTLETVLGPIWVWFTHDEVPSFRTLLGGSIVLVALIAHLLMQMVRREPQGLAKTAMPNMQ